MNNDCFGTHLPPEQLGRQLSSSHLQSQHRQHAAAAEASAMDIAMDGAHQQITGTMAPESTMTAILDSPMIDGGDSLDDIIRDNSNELYRSRSLPHPFSPHGQDGGSSRRLSMLDFGSIDDAYRSFQFGDGIEMQPNDAIADNGYHNIGLTLSHQMIDMSGLGGLADPNDYSPLSPDMIGNTMAFSNLQMDQMVTVPPSMTGMGVAANLGGLEPDQLIANAAALDSLPPDKFTMGMVPEGLPSTDAEDASSMHVDGIGDGPRRGRGVGDDTDDAGLLDSAPGISQQRPILHLQRPQVMSPEHSHGGAPYQSPVSAAPPTSIRSTSTPRPIRNATGAARTMHSTQSQDLHQAKPAEPRPTPPPSPQAPTKNIYSKTGFDMIRALYYVASRQNPQVQLGAVDMSCSFAICDLEMNDCPIIYVSENFQHLTGYSQHEILGKNCRFLQAPDGQVEAGVKREFVEDHAAFNLKRAIAERREIQQSLINYRRGGKPFLNLLTMIPIPWDSSEMRYYVGFQIDIVECPNAISTHEMSNQMQVNYKTSTLGQYIWDGPRPARTAAAAAAIASGRVDPTSPASGAALGVASAATMTAAAADAAAEAVDAEAADSGQTLTADDVSNLLRQWSGEKSGVASEWQRQAWDKMLLENSDDVVHVLSLKGTFLYLSPSCKRVLGYDAAELVGPNTAGNTLQAICHPSDYIPAMRELKDGAAREPPSFNLVLRLQQKRTGYTWFESKGTLHVEHSKGRKFIVLAGRRRPVVSLRRRDLEQHGGGIGDSEVWSKLSTSGMFLYVASNVRSLLDLQPQDLMGTSIQELMRKDSRAEFGRSIEKARRGRIVSCRHEVHNRRGQVLQAQTVLYPGDVPEGQRPSFLLAQTKLVKSSSRSLGALALGAGPTAALTGMNGVSTPNVAGGRDAAAATDVAEQRKSLGGVASGVPVATAATTMQYKVDDDNIFEEIKPTRCTSWQYELRQMEKSNRLKAEELAQLLTNRKKRKRRRSAGLVRDCANCHTRNTPEWRRGPSGQRDLCNSCGLRWAKQMGRVSPRTSSRGGTSDVQSRKSTSTKHGSPLLNEFLSGSESTPRVRAASNAAASVGASSSSPSPPTPIGGATQAAIKDSPVGGLATTMSSAGQTPASMSPTTSSIPLSAIPMHPALLVSMPPPQSHPMLAGGSGVGGGGMEMTDIREE